MTMPLPSSIAAIGDSMTQAVGVDPSGNGNPVYSWSTGHHPPDPVQSHYERILAQNSAVLSNRHNNSVSGAKMSDALAQARKAVSQEADYITFLMGANDLCTPSAATMTSPRAFKAQFVSAIDELAVGLPQARILIVSVPNVYRLWELLGDEPEVRAVWDELGVCQSLFSSRSTEKERQEVRRRNIRFNVILERVCARYARCKFDGNAVFDFPFTPEHVSRLDYFHPSRRGQQTLAEVSWKSGYWPER